MGHYTPSRRAPIRLLVAEPNAQLRRRVSAVFKEMPGFRIIGEIAAPNSLPEICADHEPDVVILGLGGRGELEYAHSAVAALRRTAQATPTIRVIVLVSGDTPDEVVEPLRAGARAVLLHDTPGDLLAEAAASVVSGYAALDPRLTSAVFECVARAHADAGGRPPTMDPSVERILSRREQEVLYELARGRRNDEIAASLGVSVGTVKTHLRHIYRKLEVDDRISAVLTAFRMRLPDAA